MDHMGPAITTVQSSLLKMAAKCEGFVNEKEADFEEAADLNNSKVYQEILLNILFFGPGIITNKFTFDDPHFQSLTKNNIIQVIDNRDEEGFLKHIHQVYDLAFTAYRELDNNKYTSKKISYEDLGKLNRPNLNESLDIIDSIERIDFCEKYISDALVPIINDLSQMFGYYFQSNISIFNDYFKDMFGKNLKTNENDLPSFNINDIFKMMGLKEFSYEEMENSENLVKFCFSPDDFENLWFNPDPENFETRLSVEMKLNMTSNPYEYFLLQSFWRTVVEFKHILELSSKYNLPLIMTENLKTQKFKSVNTKKDEMGCFKMFISERTVVPRISKLEDLLRLREDKRINPLREIIQIWNEEYYNHNNNLSKVREKIQKDISLAEKDIRKLDKVKKVSGIIGYVCIPLGVAELFTGTPISIVLGTAGLGLNYVAEKKIKKNQWIHWGLNI